MRLIKNATLFALISLLPVVGHADTLATQLRVSVDTFAIRQIDPDTPTRVLFTGEPLRGEVALIGALLPSTAAGQTTMRLPAAAWWDHLKWNLERSGGDAPALEWEATSRQVAASRADGTAELQAGQRLVATIEFGALPPGTYRLSASLGSLRSNTEWFLLSNGTESADLRREYARYKVDRSRDKQSLKRNLLDLAAADPLNASPWIRLGDLALADGTAAEIRGYYDRAVHVLDQRRQKFAAEGRQDVTASIDREREVILAVRDIVPQYVANRATLILHADLQDGRKYVLRDRATSRVLRMIAPRGVREQR